MMVDDEGEEINLDVIDDEDKNAQNPNFKKWLATVYAQNNMLSIILKLSDFVDTQDKHESENEDAEFEDLEFD